MCSLKPNSDGGSDCHSVWDCHKDFGLMRNNSWYFLYNQFYQQKIHKKSVGGYKTHRRFCQELGLMLKNPSQPQNLEPQYHWANLRPL